MAYEAEFTPTIQPAGIGGSSGSGVTSKEVPSGVIDGANTEFTLSTDRGLLFLDGMLLEEGAACITVASIAFCCLFVSETSARNDAIASQVIALNYFGFSAVAQAFPMSLSVAESVKSENGKPVKTLTRNIYESGVSFANIPFSHMLSDLHRMVFGKSRTGIPVPCGSLAL